MMIGPWILKNRSGTILVKRGERGWFDGSIREHRRKGGSYTSSFSVIIDSKSVLYLLPELHEPKFSYRCLAASLVSAVARKMSRSPRLSASPGHRRSVSSLFPVVGIFLRLGLP